jgi:hypothetical protein
MALLATGGELRMLAEAFEPEPAQLPGMFLAGVLIVVAGVWAVCMWVGMFAGLAQVSRSRAFTAMWLTFAGAVLIAAPFLALAMIVRT